VVVIVIIATSGGGGNSASSNTDNSGYVYFGRNDSGAATTSGGFPSIAFVVRTLGHDLQQNLPNGDTALSSFYCSEFAPGLGPPPVDDCVAKFVAADGSNDYHSNIQTSGNPDGSFSWEDDSSGTQSGNLQGGTLGP
jgi:hypothetical protein